MFQETVTTDTLHSLIDDKSKRPILFAHGSEENGVAVCLFNEEEFDEGAVSTIALAFGAEAIKLLLSHDLQGLLTLFFSCEEVLSSQG